MKFFRFVKSNLLFILTCFLIAFIPLYPKIPIVGVIHTWVYVRAEDFVIAAVLTIWIFLVLFKKVKLKTPLTVPIFLFWVIGAISTIHGVLILFPTLPNVFSNVAFLNFLRRIEYLSLFFVAYSAMRDKKFIYYVIATLTITLVLVALYGFGQKFLGFPAYLTGNEEFAKGVPLRISELGRVPSTFAGHYDLAAYLVLVIPIFVSLIFGFKNLLLKGLFLGISILGFALLFMTVSRVSFLVLTISLLILLVMQRKKFLILLLFLIVATLLIFSPSLTRRFGNTLTYVNVLVNAKTGQAISEVKEFPRGYFKDKVVLRDNSTLKDSNATTSAVLSYDEIPDIVEFLVPANISTGENLPQGTSYVNLELSPILRRTSMYMTKVIDNAEKKPDEIHSFLGNFLVKRARAYDLSFTTRFQGEWPRTFDAFKRNIFLGSGYGSVSLAVDNNYLRILGESGIFGFASFAALFLIGGIFLKKTYGAIDSPIARSFVLGFATGTFGLLLNALLIDVFEASKIAFSFWLLSGTVLGIAHLYARDTKIKLFDSLKELLLSPYAIAVYLLVIAIILFFPSYANYFVGDDFTWLRWVADAKSNILSYFVNSDGFFYRPGARIYFLLMYKSFWLNQTFYHLVSIVLHFIVSLLIFLVLFRILKRYGLSILASILFLFLSGHHEAIFWISSTGFLFSSIFTLLSLLFYSYFKEKGKNIYLWLSIVFIFLSTLFHELGIVTPFLIISYDFIFGERKLFSKNNILLFSPLLPYFALRLISGSLWFGGDYSYNLYKLPFNLVGNIFGYFTLDLFGPQSLRFYEVLRNLLKENLLIAIIGSVLLTAVTIWVGRLLLTKLNLNDRKILIFGTSFFLLALLPFVGLGNITSRYSYLSSIGFVIVLALLFEKSLSYIRALSDKYTFPMIVTVLSIIFLSFQLFQLQNIHTDWEVAGERVKNFLVSFEDVFLLTQYRTYSKFDKNVKNNFVFVDTPIRRGEAWVFPVGLKDALWFALQSNNFSVDTSPTVNDALYKAEITPNTSVFVFDNEGSVKKVFRIGKNVVILPDNK